MKIECINYPELLKKEAFFKKAGIRFFDNKKWNNFKERKKFSTWSEKKERRIESGFNLPANTKAFYVRYKNNNETIHDVFLLTYENKEDIILQQLRDLELMLNIKVEYYYLLNSKITFDTNRGEVMAIKLPQLKIRYAQAIKYYDGKKNGK